MDLHGQIMNLPADGATLDWANTREAYLYGHRDARHAAAELALKSDAAMEEAVKVIRELCACYGHPLPEATLERLRS